MCFIYFQFCVAIALWPYMGFFQILFHLYFFWKATPISGTINNIPSILLALVKLPELSITGINKSQMQPNRKLVQA